MRTIQAHLRSLQQAGLYRRLRPMQPVSHLECRVDGRRVVLFSTNDYLGLSGHPAVLAAASEAMARYGLGPRSAALVSGYTDLHEQLEIELAALTGKESALLFPTGYQANVGVLQALGGESAELFSDELNHASIVDGCRLSRSPVHVYRHADVEHLDSLLGASRASRKIIVTDSIFSMDGDAAPVKEIVETKRRHGALLVLDEAHALLVLGHRGSGWAEALGVESDVDVFVGTLSKAVGSLGGFIATSATLRATILNQARSGIYTTALPVPLVAASLAAVRIFTAEPDLRSALTHNTQLLAALTGRGSRTPAVPILPVVIGDATQTVDIAQALLNQGFHVAAIRPPTVPRSSSRLRITVSAAHKESDIRALGCALDELRVQSRLFDNRPLVR